MVRRGNAQKTGISGHSSFGEPTSDHGPVIYLQTNVRWTLELEKRSYVSWRRMNQLPGRCDIRTIRGERHEQLFADERRQDDPPQDRGGVADRRHPGGGRRNRLPPDDV